MAGFRAGRSSLMRGALHHSLSVLEVQGVLGVHTAKYSPNWSLDNKQRYEKMHHKNTIRAPHFGEAGSLRPANGMSERELG